uniref:Uncharacterized protein n=1 Tax=Octopus bimaculoides TaxID=37653 RepID=A0A0L8GHS5_OCTBM
MCASFCVCYTRSEVLHHSHTFEDTIGKSARPIEKPAPNMDYWRMMLTGTRHWRRQQSTQHQGNCTSYFLSGW